MTAWTSPPSNREVERFSRFLIVGAAGTLLDFSLLAALKLRGWPTLPANSLSFSAGLVNNFIWNRAWTFAGGAQADWRGQLARYTAVSLAGLALNDAIVLALEGPLGTLLGRPEWGALPAKFIATGIVVFWNYLANRSWTFRVRPLTPAASASVPRSPLPGEMNDD